MNKIYQEFNILVPKIKFMIFPDELKWQSWNAADFRRFVDQKNRHQKLLFSWLFFRWVSNLENTNIKITQPDEQDFVGKDLKVVEKHAKFMKLTLKSVGVRDS